MSFSDLEQFGADVQRRYVLGHTAADIASIVTACLKQWRQRFTLEPTARAVRKAMDG